MAFSRVIAPKVDSNDDYVLLSNISVSVGDSVEVDEVLFEIESDKSVSEILAEKSGVVLRIDFEAETRIKTGQVVMWIGDSSDEIANLPDQISPEPVISEINIEGCITMKAQLLLDRYGLKSEDILSANQNRLVASDVLDYIGSLSSVPEIPSVINSPNKNALLTGANTDLILPETVEHEALSSAEKTMVDSVKWHRDYPVTGYIEMTYDPSRWTVYSKDYATCNGLLMDPLLSLMAYRLVQAVCDHVPKANTTVWGGDRLRYHQINLGFTVQVKDILFMVVVKGADKMSEEEFLDELGQLQRRAMRNKLKPEEAKGSTIAFTSMSKWNVSRHVPILPTGNSFIMAHSSPTTGPLAGTGIIGATYDHRILHGFDVARILNFVVDF